MAEKRMTFIVKKDGGGVFTVKTEGYTGAQCESAVEAMVGALSAKVKDGGDTDKRYVTDDPDVLVNSIKGE